MNAAADNLHFHFLSKLRLLEKVRVKSEYSLPLLLFISKNIYNLFRTHIGFALY